MSEDFGPLPEAYAEVLDLKNAGRSHEYIAEFLGISPRTSREKVKRALMHLAGTKKATEYYESAKPVSKFEVGDLTPCKRCGLRGEHECLPDRAEAFLGRKEEPNF